MALNTSRSNYNLIDRRTAKHRKVVSNLGLLVATPQRKLMMSPYFLVVRTKNQCYVDKIEKESCRYLVPVKSILVRKFPSNSSLLIGGQLSRADRSRSDWLVWLHVEGTWYCLQQPTHNSGIIRIDSELLLSLNQLFCLGTCRQQMLLHMPIKFQFARRNVTTTNPTLQFLLHFN